MLVDEIGVEEVGRPKSLLAIVLARSASATRAADKLAMFVGPSRTSAKARIGFCLN